MKAKTKTVYLGSLGLMEKFRLPKESTVYRTITYAPSIVPTTGTRWCLNLTTNTAQWFFCREKVNIEFSEESENE